MAINIDTFKVPITVAEARNVLQRQTDNFGVFFDVDRCIEIAGILQLEMLKANTMAREITKSTLNIADKYDVIQAFLKLGVRKATFFPGRAKDAVLDSKVRTAILNDDNSEDAKELARLHGLYTSAKRNTGNLLNFAKLPRSLALSKNNRRMSIGNPKWSILSTSRLAASDPGIQGVPKIASDIITEPKGYTLIRCDSAQIEPKINFSHYVRDELVMNLIMAYQDAYYGIMHFCTMSDSALELCRQDFDTNFKKKDITDEIKSMRENIKTLTNAGSYGSSNLQNVNIALADAYNKRIVNHPKRLAFERKVTEDVNRGVNVFYSAFGTPITPDSTERYDKEASGWKEHLIRCGINNPVQATASDLMLFSIYEAVSVLKEAKDTHICFYKHDEACFYVSDEDMANGIGDKLSDVTAYNVKGWLPIASDCHVGIKPGRLPSYL